MYSPGVKSDTSKRALAPANPFQATISPIARVFTDVVAKSFELVPKTFLPMSVSAPAAVITGTSLTIRPDSLT